MGIAALVKVFGTNVQQLSKIQDEERILLSVMLAKAP